jgi:hypothetical protein
LVMGHGRSKLGLKIRRQERMAMGSTFIRAKHSSKKGLTGKLS